jgi:hypothetical protein
MKGMNEAIDDIILSRGTRGMSSLKKSLAPGYCSRAAVLIRDNPGTVLIATGFPVGGHFETDGPVGAIALYRVLEELGYDSRFVCAPPLLDILSPGFRVTPFPIAEERESLRRAEDILESVKPSLILSIERAGVSADGRYYNMRGRDISRETARIDSLFHLCKCPTVAVGDGGNEIGMGNISQALTELPIIPSVTAADELVIATVSNWGAYGIIRCLEILLKRSLFGLVDRKEIYDFLFSRGAVDGVTGRIERSEDGFSWEVGEDIIRRLGEVD